MPMILFFFGDVDDSVQMLSRTGRDVPGSCTRREALWWLHLDWWLHVCARGVTSTCMGFDAHKI